MQYQSEEGPNLSLPQKWVEFVSVTSQQNELVTWGLN